MISIQTKLKNIGDYGCLCFCYLYVIGVPPESLLEHYEELIDRNIIDENCFVKDGYALCKYFLKKDVKIVFTSSDNHQFDKYISNFTYEGKNHFVVTDRDDKVIFNSLDHSVCVEKGKIASKRVVVII
jgi:hypothetical protein